MGAADDRPIWGPIAARVDAYGYPFCPLHDPTLPQPLAIRPEHRDLPHWTAANEPVL